MRGQPIVINTRQPLNELLTSPAYERYCLWCVERGISPATFEHWQKVTQSISGTNYANYWG